MTLEEAIIHSREVAKEKRSEGCIECANEHKQLAKWLEELKTLRKAYNLACEGHGNYYCRDICGEEIDCSDKSCSECLKVYFMQKARENNGA